MSLTQLINGISEQLQLEIAEEIELLALKMTSEDKRVALKEFEESLKNTSLKEKGRRHYTEVAKKRLGL